jgi:BioD-like phosphotransacetylase family protein
MPLDGLQSVGPGRLRIAELCRALQSQVDPVFLTGTSQLGCSSVSFNLQLPAVTTS